jgi:two-component system KDP operon response regulator KdpE
MSVSRSRILVIDDEPQMHRFLGPALEAGGYAVERADTGTDGLRLAASRAPDAVLLDLGLPDLDGLEVLTRLRQFSTVPVIILSARDREVEKVAALDQGADDYVEKPFGVSELLARIRVALRHRRIQDNVPERLAIGGLELDFAALTVRDAAGALLPLSPLEWALLSLMARNLGRILTHKQLLTAVWGPAHAADVQYLRVYIGQLRQKLGSAGSALRTETGIGYRLVE